MHWPELKKSGYEQLFPIYGEIESNSMLRILFEDLLDKSTVLNREQCGLFHDAITRLLQFEPIQYITGHSHFMGLNMCVNKAVLIPRFETEELVALTIKKIGSQKLKVLDIGTGSGCIALAIKKYCPNAEVWGTDISEQALYIAEKNAGSLDLNVNFIHSDFLNRSGWNVLPNEIDILVSNPPYIGQDEKSKMDTSTLLFEPATALFAGKDPLQFYKKIVEFSKLTLHPMGKILVEINEFKSLQTLQIFETLEYKCLEVIKDIHGKDRIIYCEI